MNPPDRTSAIAECAERLSKLRERFLEIDERNVDDLRVEIDRELREIAMLLFVLDGRDRVAGQAAIAASSRMRRG